jgi:hypothetical protein
LILLFVIFNIFESDLFPAHALAKEPFNPARLAGGRSELTSFGREQFGLSGFRALDLTIAVRSASVELGTFGNEAYRENQLALGFGCAAGGMLAAGAEIGILNCRIPGYANRFGYRLKLGGLVRSDPFTSGIWLNNVNRPRFNETDRLPLSYGIDLRYAVSERVTPYFSILGAEGILPFIKFGFDIDPAPTVRLTAGVNSEPVQVEYGIRLCFRAFRFLYSGSTHSQLGLTHGLGIQLAAP